MFVVSFSGFFRFPFPLGDKAAKRATPEGNTSSFAPVLVFVFHDFLDLLFVLCAVLDVATFQDFPSCAHLPKSKTKMLLKCVVQYTNKYETNEFKRHCALVSAPRDQTSLLVLVTRLLLRGRVLDLVVESMPWHFAIRCPAYRGTITGTTV